LLIEVLRCYGCQVAKKTQRHEKTKKLGGERKLCQVRMLILKINFERKKYKVVHAAQILRARTEKKVDWRVLAIGRATKV
jgi:hypothetical protein